MQVKALGPVPVKGLRRAGGGLRAGRGQYAPATLAGRRRAGTHPLCGAAAGAGGAAAGPGAGRRRATGRWSPWSARPAWGSRAWSTSVVHSHHTQGWRVLESASVSYGKATPYFPVHRPAQALLPCGGARRRRAPSGPRSPGRCSPWTRPSRTTIPALLALLDALPDDSPFLTLDPPQRRQRTLEALKRVLLRESQVQPLLLVFEDLHWIDTETQALLDSLVESLPTARLLLLVNYRPEYQHGWGSKTYYTQLRLDPLPPASAEAVPAGLLGDDPSLVPLTQLLIARTEGNPFFLEESVRTLVETGVLVGEPGAYRLAQALPTIQVPATVQAVLAARIDRLPPEEKRLLQTAAVIGTEVPLPLLQAIAELSEEALHRGLAHLQAAEFLYETRLFPEREYTFKHALTHEVAYGSLLQERRRVLHARIVEALEALAGERVPSRSNAWRTMPCGARCGTRPWHTAGRRARRRWRGRPAARPWATLSRPSGRCRICQNSRTRVRRPLISASTCARRSARSGRLRGS